MATTTHDEVDIEGGKALGQIALRDDIEGSRVVKDVVVESKVTAKINEPLMVDAISRSSGGCKYLGMRFTPRSLRLVQLAFLTSAAALVSSSAESLPAQ